MTKRPAPSLTLAYSTVAFATLASLASIACGRTSFVAAQKQPPLQTPKSQKPAAEPGAKDSGAQVAAGAQNPVLPLPEVSVPVASGTPMPTPVQDISNVVAAVVPSTTPAPSATPAPSPLPVATTAGANPVAVHVCSEFLEVPAKANPWLAGASSGTQLTYPQSSAIDKAPSEAPPLHASDCLTAAKKLVFETESNADHGGGSFVQQGEGKVDSIATFMLGAVRGLSGLNAPFDSLVAVFLPANYDGTEPPPAQLDFGTSDKRNFDELRPQLRQVFFIGDGRMGDGRLQKFVVPAGATRLAFGNMDSFEWNNNVGSHRVRVNEALP